ncbi:hypothetical protein TEA_003164 [Camellia sinensis var. sinensis]|uniref:HMA domain-containing protein n=1 Tax=Camellia sinensis var. sinensis TaxID=542762 RepID=A0A4S4EVS9_CAMSN|nr:hypothetical protein TEA_003164 [Camellia sinensis var. sinensis]
MQDMVMVSKDFYIELWEDNIVQFTFLLCTSMKVNVPSSTLNQLNFGIDQVSVDAEKGTLTVIGNVDPVCVTTQVRKTGKVVELISVGPPKKDTKPQPQPQPICFPPCCKECQLVGITSVPYDGGSSCSILGDLGSIQGLTIAFEEGYKDLNIESNSQYAIDMLKGNVEVFFSSEKFSGGFQVSHSKM